MKTPMITKNAEKFPIDQLLKYGNKTKGFSEKGEYISYSYYTNENNNSNYLYGIENINYSITNYFDDNVCSIQKQFYGNGMIKEKGVFFNRNDNTKIGIWYEYDDTGKLLKEIDYNDGYKFSFQDVLSFCQLRKIKVVKGDVRKLPGGFYTQILKDNLNSKKVWIIKYQDGIKNTEKVVTEGDKVIYKDIYEEIILDGQTGKVISEKTINQH